MHRFGYCFVILLVLALGSQPCHAAKLKAYVSRFSVSLYDNKEDLKLALQALLMSRLNSEEIQAVDNQSDADIQITGSYVAFGDVFSLDVLAKTSSGVFIDRVFVQGDTHNELIPSTFEMARQLQRAILKWHRNLTGKPGNAAPADENLPSAPAKNKLSSKPKKELPEAKPVVKLKKELSPETKPVRTSELSAQQKEQKLPTKPWVSQRLSETLNSISVGRTTPEGVEIFITGEHYLRYYLKKDKLLFISAVAFNTDEKIIGVDVSDLGQNDVPEIYVTVLKGGLPASQVYIVENNALKKIAGNIPYMLRGIALEGKEKKIFAQKINASGNFTGDVYELVKRGDNFTAENPIQLPLFGNLYSFNKFIDSKGEHFFLVSHPDGYLLVYSKEKKQLWKSRDKFGGSETFVCQSDNRDPSSPLNTACTLPQRLQVNKAGDIFVSRNTGLTTRGATRNYTKSSVVQLFWNGSSLQEKRRTEQSNNYLADFSYNDQSKGFLLLEVEPKSDTQEERGSKVVVKTME